MRNPSTPPINITVTILGFGTTIVTKVTKSATRILVILDPHGSVQDLNIPYGLLTKDNMPEKLHDTATVGVVQLGVQQPLSDLDIVVQRPLVDLLIRHGELRTAGTPNRHTSTATHGEFRRQDQRGSWAGGIRVEKRRRRVGEDLPPHRLGDVRVVLERVLTARVGVAAQIGVARGGDVVELQVLQRVDVVV